MFFVDKISRMKDLIANRLIGRDNDPFMFDNAHTGDAFELLQPATEDEVRKLLGSTSSKSSPMDFVPTSIIKRCSGVSIPLITRLANLSLTDGNFPTLFKHAQVTPLFKHAGLDTNNPSNVRPMSNLNTISKLIERLVLARLHSHITQSTNFNQFQAAYRQHQTLYGDGTDKHIKRCLRNNWWWPPHAARVVRSVGSCQHHRTQHPDPPTSA